MRGDFAPAHGVDRRANSRRQVIAERLLSLSKGRFDLLINQRLDLHLGHRLRAGESQGDGSGTENDGEQGKRGGLHGGAGTGNGRDTAMANRNGKGRRSRRGGIFRIDDRPKVCKLVLY